MKLLSKKKMAAVEQTSKRICGAYYRDLRLLRKKYSASLKALIVESYGASSIGRTKFQDAYENLFELNRSPEVVYEYTGHQTVEIYELILEHCLFHNEELLEEVCP